MELIVNVFLDTEFTDLLNPKLISIGFIAENQRSLYLEVQDWNPGGLQRIRAGDRAAASRTTERKAFRP